MFTRLILILIGWLATSSVAYWASGATSESLGMVIEIAISMALGHWFYSELGRRSRITPVFEVGSIFTAVLLAYTILPIVGFLVGVDDIFAFIDNRLQQNHPTNADLTEFCWRYVLFLACFTTAYLLRRNPEPDNEVQGKLDTCAAPELWTCAAIYGGAVLFKLAVTAIYGLEQSGGYENAAEAYKQVQALPTIVQQLSHNIEGVGLGAKLFLMVYLFSRFKEPSQRLVLGVWMALEIGIGLMTTTSRTPIFITVVSCALLIHQYVRPWRKLEIAAGGVAGLLIFLLSGFFRMSRSEFIDGSLITILSTSNEFQSVFTTAYDIYCKKQAGELQIPFELYIADFARMIPQQILSNKVDQGEWYLVQIGMDGTGIGFTYGTMSECIVGLDWIHVLALASLMGYLMARIHNWYKAKSSSPMRNICYLWLCVRCYVLFRVSSFYLLGPFVFTLCPLLVLLEMVSGRLSAAPPVVPAAPEAATPE